MTPKPLGSGPYATFEEMTNQVRPQFYCKKMENAGGTPGHTLFRTGVGRNAEFSLYENEATALWESLGKALGKST